MVMYMDIDKKQYKFKNGGFPPINYCPELDTDKTKNIISTKERFFANTPRQNINIRQLLNESINKKPLFIPDVVSEDLIEVVDDL
jgi:hypothetical protein